MHWTDSKNMQSELAHPDYDPDFFLDAIMHKAGVPNDRALARELDVAPPVISKIRSRGLCIGPTYLVRIHELTGLKVKELRELMFGRDLQGQILDKFFCRRRITQPLMPRGKEMLTLQSGDIELRIWTNDRRIAINVQARCGTQRVTVGIANVIDKSMLFPPPKREIEACSPGLGRKLLLLAYTSLGLFESLSEKDGGLLQQHRLRERLNLIKDAKDLQHALELVNAYLNRKGAATSCYKEK